MSAFDSNPFKTPSFRIPMEDVPLIYLDYTANAPVEPAVLERFVEAEREFIGNPNSLHQAGRASAARMRQITADIAALLSVPPEALIYTSGASEANNLAIKGLTRAYRHSGRHILTTPLEHPSVSGCLTALQEAGYEIEMLPLTVKGQIDLAALRELLRQDTVLVAISAVDSELGTAQPVAEIAALLAAYPNCHLHVDATQAIGKIPFSFAGIDTVSFAPHKFGGLNGCGMLVRGKDVVLEPLIHGGHSTTLYRSGTPALALAASTQTALELALPRLEERLAQIARLNRGLRSALTTNTAVAINSPGDAIPHILNLSVEGIRGAVMRDKLDEHGICVGVKSACSVENTPSRAVMAVSHNRKRALSSFRVSLSHLTTEEELRTFLSAFDTICKELIPCRAR